MIDGAASAPELRGVPADGDSPAGVPLTTATDGPIRVKSSLSEGPSERFVGDLEQIGTLDKRHDELEKRVRKLEEEMDGKADKDDVTGSKFCRCLFTTSVDRSAI